MRNKDCTLMMVVMKWRKEMGASTHEPPHGQAIKGVGVAESFIGRIWPLEGGLAADVVVDVAATEFLQQASCMGNASLASKDGVAEMNVDGDDFALNVKCMGFMEDV